MKTESRSRRLWDRMRSSYRSKISLAGTLLLILFMGIGFAEMYLFTRNILLERTHRYMHNSAASCSINIVNSIEEIEDVTLSILDNSAIQEALLQLELVILLIGGVQGPWEDEFQDLRGGGLGLPAEAAQVFGSLLIGGGYYRFLAGSGLAAPDAAQQDEHDQCAGTQNNAENRLFRVEFSGNNQHIHPSY